MYIYIDRHCLDNVCSREKSYIYTYVGCVCIVCGVCSGGREEVREEMRKGEIGMEEGRENGGGRGVYIYM